MFIISCLTQLLSLIYINLPNKIKKKPCQQYIILTSMFGGKKKVGEIAITVRGS